MYIGRIVAIGMNQSKQAFAMYRVSSRSFPNRQTIINGDKIAVVPRDGFEGDLKRNPYISYNCAGTAGSIAVVSNGSHTDPIVEKIKMGLPVRDAFTLGLLAMDYEKDSLDTPRIIAAVDATAAKGWLGIVRKDALLVREFDLTPGHVNFVSTYETNRPCDENCDDGFEAKSADEACNYIISGGVFANFDNPVCAASVLADANGFKFAAKQI